ncbi:hypothetical protein KA025_03455 [Candidatus Saccharibacteria bacterium]|nr:hypothetical protein [Candidatus Saccharibacteria bacterium]
MNKPEYNYYPTGTQAPSLSKDDLETITSAPKANDNDVSFGGLLNLMKNGIQKSKNYIKGATGWYLGSDGTFEFNPNPTSSRCRVYLAADYAVTAGGARKLTLDTESYDTSSEFDPTTNYRFTATNAGTYFINASLKIDANTDQILYQLMIYKNGSKISEFAHQTSTANTFTMQITDVVSLAAGDYIEIYVDSGEGANYTAKGGSALTYLNIQRVA